MAEIVDLEMERYLREGRMLARELLQAIERVPGGGWEWVAEVLGQESAVHLRDVLENFDDIVRGII